MDKTKKPAAASAESDLTEINRVTAADVAKFFRVPDECLIEPGHVMSSERWERMKAEMAPYQK